MIGRRIGIAGVGLIGGSIALRARSLGAVVTGYDRDASAQSRAVERGALDGAASDLRSLARSSDVLVIALPVDAALTALAGLSRAEAPLLVIDVASVKAPFERFAATLPTFVGTHPMAGREIGGINAASGDLFIDATWAYVPHPDPVLTGRVRDFIRSMGARPLEVDAARHDAIVALTSHLPQTLSVALAGELAAAIRADPRVRELCGPGIMSMLRLARSPAATWAPIVTANAAPLADHLRSIAQALVVAAEGLDRGDSAPLMSYFDDAHDVTDALEERFRAVSRS